LLGLISLINDTSSELIYPLIPLYLSSVLLVGPQTLGIIEGVVEAFGSLLKLFSGVISDKIQNTKWLVVSGYSLSCIIKPLLAFAFIWPLVLLIRFTDKIGKALRTAPRDALLASSVDAKIRGKAFGLHRAMDNAGAVIGPLLAAGLLYLGLSFQKIFLWTVLPGILCILLTLIIQEPKKVSKISEIKLSEKEKPGKEKFGKEKTRFHWQFKTLPKMFKRYLVVVGLFSLGNSSNMFILLRAKELGISTDMVPVLWALCSFTAMLFSTPLSALSDKLGRKTLIIMGWCIYGLFYLSLALYKINIQWLWPLFAFYGLFMAASEGTEKAYVADLSGTSSLGTTYGWFSMVSGIMLLPASILFGYFWQWLHPEFAFLFSALLALLAMLLLKFWVKS